MWLLNVRSLPHCHALLTRHVAPDDSAMDEKCDGRVLRARDTPNDTPAAPSRWRRIHARQLRSVRGRASVTQLSPLLSPARVIASPATTSREVRAVAACEVHLRSERTCRLVCTAQQPTRTASRSVLPRRNVNFLSERNAGADWCGLTVSRIYVLTSAAADTCARLVRVRRLHREQRIPLTVRRERTDYEVDSSPVHTSGARHPAAGVSSGNSSPEPRSPLTRSGQNAAAITVTESVSYCSTMYDQRARQWG